MTKPVVLELDGLNDDEKALAMMFLSATVRAHAKANRRSGVGLTHVILLEEAHNIIGRGGGGGGEGQANPKEVAVRFFTRMLAEMRALGEGVIIADQLPTAIASEAVKSTNLKIMHRVVAADDREELGKSMLLDAGQMELAAQMSAGQSLVFREGWPRTRAVLEPDFKRDYGVEMPPDDQELRRTMQLSLEAAGLADIYRPFAGCSASCKICDARIREQAERWTERKLPIISDAIAADPSGSPIAIAFSEFCDDLDTPPGDAVRWNCHYQHFLERVKPRLEVPK
jgi:DNA helicase HerA-like ATPase